MVGILIVQLTYSYADMIGANTATLIIRSILFGVAIAAVVDFIME